MGLLTEYVKRKLNKQGIPEGGGLIAPEKKATHSPDDPADPSSYKRGGKVKKTGWAKVHKGERVLTKKQDRKRMRGKSM